MTCIVQQTHERGVAKARGSLGSSHVGEARLYSIMHPEMKRSVRVLQLMPIGEGSTPGADTLIAGLLDPQVLSFSSDKGLAMSGFEEIAGQRFYQGWIITWPN